MAAGKTPPYAVRYHKKMHSLPWSVLLLEGYDNAPWLPLLPPEVNFSLSNWGRHLFSQMPACKRGSISVDAYREWAQNIKTRMPLADILAKCCSAFAHSPLSIVVHLKAAVQCIRLAVRACLGSEDAKLIMPSEIEQYLDQVCAAGCGKDLSHIDPLFFPEFGPNLRYCSEQCSNEVSMGF